MTKLHATLAYAKRFICSVRDYVPLTWLGLTLTVISLYALRAWAYVELDLVVLVAGYVGLAVVVTAVLLVTLVTLGLKLALRTRWKKFTNIALETWIPTTTGQSVATLWWMPVVSVRWQWLFPGRCRVVIKRQGMREHETVIAQERGEFPHIQRRILIEDVMGLARLTLRHTQTVALEINSSVGAIGNVPLLSAYTGGEELAHPYGRPEGDRIELRRYTAGDPARLIHWKLYARTRKLMSRSPELALSATKRVLAYFVTGEQDDASAAAARVAIQRGGLGEDWLFGADGTLSTATTEPEALHLLRCSKQTCPKGPTRLEAFMRQQRAQEPSSLLVFAPPVFRSDWVNSIINVSHEHRGPLRVILGIDTLPHPSERRVWQRFLMIPPEHVSVRMQGLRELLQQLHQHRIEAVVIERHTGRVFHQSEFMRVQDQKVA